MAKARKATAPPPTEILSVSEPRQVPSETRTSPEEELASSTTPEPTPGTTEEMPGSEQSVEQPFTFEEGEEEPQEPELQGTEKALRDTKAELTKTQQELAGLKQTMQAIVTQQGLTGSSAGFPRSEGSDMPAEFFSEEMLPNETLTQDPNYPQKYLQRLRKADRIHREQEDIQKGFQDFVERNPNWSELVPQLQTVYNEDPWAYQGAAGFKRLCKHALERKKATDLQSQINQLQSDALQRGVQMGKQSKGKSFVSPSGATAPAGTSSTSKVPPADFHQWSTDKQREWLSQHGYIKED